MKRFWMSEVLPDISKGIPQTTEELLYIHVYVYIYIYMYIYTLYIEWDEIGVAVQSCLWGRVELLK